MALWLMAACGSGWAIDTTGRAWVSSDGGVTGGSAVEVCQTLLAIQISNGNHMPGVVFYTVDMSADGTAGNCKLKRPVGDYNYYGFVSLLGPCAPGYVLQPDGSCRPSAPEVKACPVSHPVFPGSGVKTLTERDDAGSLELPISRTYRSDLSFRSIDSVGGWMFNWKRGLDVSLTTTFTSNPITVLGEDGTVRVFRKSAGVWTAAGTSDTISQSGTTWVYTVAASGARETYDAKGNLISVRDRTGKTTTLTYNPQSQLTAVTAPSGRSLTFGYNGQGRISSITAPDGAITQYAYNTNGMLTTVAWPDNTTRQYVYEDTRFPTALTGVIDEAGVRYATYAYDDQGRAITSELTAGADRYQFQYQANGQTTVLTPDGGSSVYSFLKQNGVLLPTGVSAPCPTCGNTALSTSYDSNNNATSKTGYDGSTTSYTYDTLGRETQRIEGAGTAYAKTTTTEWDPQQWLVTRVAAPNKIEAFSYDANGNLLSHTVTPTIDTNGSQGFAAVPSGDAEGTEWTYDANGQVLTATDKKGGIVVGAWTFTYDGNGNLLTLTNPSGQTGTIVRYDAAGRVLEAVDTEGQVHKLTYNVRGRLTDRQIEGLNIHYDYDSIGQVVAVSGPQDMSARYVYDAAHRLIEIIDNLAIQEQSSNATTLASPFATEQTQGNGGTTSSTMTRVKSMLVNVWNTALSWLRGVVSKFISSAHAQAAPGSLIGYRPPVPTPTGSQAINVVPRPENELDTNVGSRRMPPDMAGLNVLLQVQQACSAAVNFVVQAFSHSTPPGDCDWDEFKRRNKAVTDACKTGQTYCKAGDDTATLLAKKTSLQSCGNARRDLMDRCFRGGDARHQKEWVKIIQQVAICNGL